MTVPEPDPAAQAACVDAAVTLFGIAVEPAWRPAILASFATLAAAATLVLEFPLDDDAEYGPVFRP